MKQHVWVIERFVNREWKRAGVFAYGTETEALLEINDRQITYDPSDKLRAVKYVREDAHANR